MNGHRVIYGGAYRKHRPTPCYIRCGAVNGLITNQLLMPLPQDHFGRQRREKSDNSIVSTAENLPYTLGSPLGKL